MRPQLIHLVLLCTIMLINFTTFSRANDDNERYKEFKRLFDETSEPLEPEEAQRLLTRQHEFYRDQGEPSDPVEREQFQARHGLLRNLLYFELFCEDCDGDGDRFWLVDFVAKQSDRLPALKNYLSDLRDNKLRESCNRQIVSNLQEYKYRAYTRDKTVKDMIEFAFESLSSVPAQSIWGKDWLNNNNNNNDDEQRDQVSAALYAVMKKYRPFLKRFSCGNSGKDFRELFTSTVGTVCLRLPKWPWDAIVPSYMADYFIREGKLDQLNQSAVNWGKLARICRMIQLHPDKAADIVSDYKDKQKRESRAEQKQHGCL